MSMESATKIVGNVVEVAISEIKVTDGRYRVEMGDVEGLAESISAVGQMIPIILTEDYTLIAGERRLKALTILGHKTAKAIIETRADINSRILEITENLERKDFTWQEQVLAMEDLHTMMKALKGPRWSARGTAKEIGLSKSNVCTDLDLAKALKEDPDLFKKCESKKQALKILQKYKIDETMAEITLRRSKTDYGKSARNHVFLGDCTKLIDKLPDKILNAVISDPFYGIDIDKVKKFDKEDNVGGIYKDDLALYKLVMGNIISKLPRVMNSDGWVVMFCAIQNFYWLYNELKKAGFTPDVIPGVWYKTGTSGQTNQAATFFGRVYEVFIYAYRGNASLIRPGSSNVIQCSVIPSIDKDHPVEKPLALMEEIISRFCLPGHVILDPMCGSASTLVAAIRRGCNPIGFELDERHYNLAINNVADALKMKDAGRLDLVGGNK